MSHWLLSTLAATSGLVLLVLLLREPVRRSFGSRVTYSLWLIPAARMLMPTLTTTIERSVPALPMVQPGIGDHLVITNVAPVQPSLVDQLGGWPIILLAVWLTIASALFLSRMVAFQRDRRAILTSSKELAREGSIRILCSPDVASPVAFGIVDRVVALPVDFGLTYGSREQRLALEHELAHHRSGDLVANLFAFVLLCLQWFNPLAWVAHAAFRFDQEAACDARVLDKANAGDRSDYGRAIAKAASGRTLLFASALDRRNRLHRRLKSMLRNSSPTQRTVGRLFVGVAIAVTLPLTASRAINYVDVPAAPVAHPLAAAPTAAPSQAAIVHPVALATVAAQVAAPPPASPSDDGDISIGHDTVTIDGVSKRWEELTPAEKDRLRRAVSKAREGLAKAHFARDDAMRDAKAAVEHIDMAKLQRDVAQAQENAQRALQGLSQNSADLRRFGVDPEQLAAQVRQSLSSVDPQQIQRALANIDTHKIAASMDEAKDAMRRAQAELDRIDARLKAEGH